MHSRVSGFLALLLPLLLAGRAPAQTQTGKTSGTPPTNTTGTSTPSTGAKPAGTPTTNTTVTTTPSTGSKPTGTVVVTPPVTNQKPPVAVVPAPVPAPAPGPGPRGGPGEEVVAEKAEQPAAVVARPKQARKDAPVAAAVDYSERAANAIPVGGVGRMDGVPDFLSAPNGESNNYHSRSFQAAPLPTRLAETPHPARLGIRDARGGAPSVAPPKVELAAAGPAFPGPGAASLAAVGGASALSLDAKVASLHRAVAPAEPRSRAAQQLVDAEKAFRLREWPAAMEKAVDALREEPANVDALLLLSRIALKRELCGEAEGHARQAVVLAPRRADARKALARALYCRRTPEALREALSEVSLATDWGPKDADGWAARAAIESALGKKFAAERSLEQASRLDARYEARLRSVREGAEIGDADVAEELAAAELAAGGRSGGASAGSLLGLLFLSLAAGAFFLPRRGGAAAAASPAPAAPAAALLLADKYEMVRVLARTPGGDYLEARDRRLGRTVGIRRTSAKGDPARLETLARAARVAGALRHPGLLDIYEVLVEDDAVIVVFEWIKGKTAAQVLSKRGRLSLEEAADALQPVCEAVEASHGRRLTRGRLALDRIVFTEQGFTKLADLDGRPDAGAPGEAADVRGLAACLRELVAGNAVVSTSELAPEVQALLQDASGNLSAGDFLRRLKSMRSSARAA